MIKFVDEGKQDCPCGDCQQERRLKRQQKRLNKIHGQTARHSSRKAVKLPLQRHKSCPSTHAIDELDDESLPAPVALVLGSTATPVNPFPIERTGDVDNTMQYFFEVFTGSIHPLIDIPAEWKPKAFYDRKFCYCISDLGWFSATFAFAQAMKQRTISGKSHKSNEILKHSAQGVTELRRKLLKGKDGVDDLAILTITSLMSTDLVLHQVSNWKMHIEGLERILSLRGGIDSFNNDFLKYKVIGFQTHWLYQQMILSSAPPDLTYPKHPFSPELCTAISMLPGELSELALCGLLNKATISLMSDLAIIINRFHRTGTKAREDCRRLNLLAYELGDLHDSKGSTYFEQLIAMAATEFSISVGEDRKNHWLLCGTVQMTASTLLQHPVEYEDRFHNVLIWVAAVFLATGEPQSQTVKYARKILTRCQKKKPLYEAEVLKICGKYVWDDFLTPKLREKGDFGDDPNTLLSVQMTPSDSASSIDSGQGRTTPKSIYNVIL